MAKLGPFCSRDNCSLVRGVLERLITHLSNGSLHVCGLGGLPLVEFPCDVRVDVWLVEGVGAWVWQEHWKSWKLWKILEKYWMAHLAGYYQTAIIVIDVVDNGFSVFDHYVGSPKQHFDSQIHCQLTFVLFLPMLLVPPIPSFHPPSPISI